MSKKFDLGEKTVTVNDEALKRYEECMGYPLDKFEVKGYITSHFSGSPFSEKKTVPYEEAVRTHSSKQLSDIVNNFIMKEFEDYE